jgi:hypothetical protein
MDLKLRIAGREQRRLTRCIVPIADIFNHSAHAVIWNEQSEVPQSSSTLTLTSWVSSTSTNKQKIWNEIIRTGTCHAVEETTNAVLVFAGKPYEQGDEVNESVICLDLINVIHHF